jgi:tetratricopeptide (TPR) repeat protein
MGQQPNKLTPSASPRHYWGAKLRELREEAGLSLAQLGRIVHSDASHLGRIERGERPIPRPLAVDCDRALAADGALVQLYEGSGFHVAKHASHVASSSASIEPSPVDQASWVEDGDITVPVQRHDGRIILVNVPRRLFLQEMGAATLGTAAASILPLPRFAKEIVAEHRSAEHFEVVRRTLADNDNLFGPERVIPVASGQVKAIEHIRRSLGGDEQKNLLLVQTQFADLLGWLYQDSGDFRASQYWMDRALEWSHLAGDPDSIAFVLARKSQLAADMHDPGSAINAAEAALAMARPRSRSAAIAATYAAHGHALDGNRGECDRFYDEAVVLLADADADASPWGKFFGVPYIAVQRAGSLATLQDHRAAADGFRAAVDDLQPGFHRDRGVYLSREAVAYARSGEGEHAAALGMQALSIGAETGSGRIFTELANLESSLPQSGASSPVSDFRSALRETFSAISYKSRLKLAEFDLCPRLLPLLMTETG